MDINSFSPSEKTTLLQLSRQAIRAESTNALQFLLVNRTHSLKRFTIGIFWVENEGVIAQSGVSEVDRNAPFIQWLNSICISLSKQPEAFIVTSDLLNMRDLNQWSEFLPESAIWFPIVIDDTQCAGLLLCRSELWPDSDLIILQEWIELWGCLWVKMQRPSVVGELTLVWKKLLSWLPSTKDIRDESDKSHDVGMYDTQFTKYKSEAFSKTLGQTCREFLMQLQTSCLRIKRQGLADTIKQVKKEVKYIWFNPLRHWKLITVLILLCPMRLTVLVPAELVPANPAVIRSPIEGVIDEIFVKPNQQVEDGQLLFKLDLTNLVSRLNVADQETQIAASEYRQSAIQSLSDAKSRAQLVPQESKAAQRKVEADYLKEMVAKAQIKSPRNGVVLFDDPSEWIGKPLVAGEKVMVVATEGDIEIEAWVPLSDAIKMPENAPVVLYLNATPFSPVDGKMRYIGHEALQRPDGSYAYRLRAKLNPGEGGVRVGLKGTGKISGQFVPFGYLIFRKPIGALRQFLGI